jgi:hypothetical protein
VLRVLLNIIILLSLYACISIKSQKFDIETQNNSCTDMSEGSTCKIQMKFNLTIDNSPTSKIMTLWQLENQSLKKLMG